MEDGPGAGRGWNGVLAGRSWIKDSLEQEDGASLSEPHIDHDIRIMVCLYHLQTYHYAE